MEPIRQTKHITPFSCLQMAKEYQMGEAKDGNFVFSPFSIQLALSLLANGSTGSTKTELLTFLNAENLDDLNSSYEQLLEVLCQATKGAPVISVVGGVWLDQSLLLKPSFRTIATTIYKAKVETVDFQNEVKANEVIEKVNQWAKEATEGLIKSVLPKNSFSSLTRQVLANALYFKGRWSTGFNKLLTKDSTFYLLDGNSVQVSFMSSTCDRRISVLDDFKILQLYYEGGYKKHISMYIILPNERDGLWSLMEKVCSDASFIEKYAPRKVLKVGEFKVPKFKIKYGFEASDVFKSIGLKLPFSPEAEFEEMICKGSVAVSKVHHMAHIDVNEEGTEAAGITVIEHWMMASDCDSRPSNPPVDFVADHPFIFMIRESQSGALLFMGHVINPLLQ